MYSFYLGEWKASHNPITCWFTHHIRNTSAFFDFFNELFGAGITDRLCDLSCKLSKFQRYFYILFHVFHSCNHYYALLIFSHQNSTVYYFLIFVTFLCLYHVIGWTHSCLTTYFFIWNVFRFEIQTSLRALFLTWQVSHISLTCKAT